MKDKARVARIRCKDCAFWLEVNRGYGVCKHSNSSRYLHLVVTPESWEEGFLYKWLPPELRPYRPGQEQTASAMQWGCWFGLTMLYERLLMKHGAALIRRGSFFTNMKGNHGAVTRYDLATMVREVALV